MIFLKEKSEKVWVGIGVALVVDVVLWVWICFGGTLRNSDPPRLSFLDVGQGDSSLIELPSGVQVLIDGGPDGAKLLESLEAVLPPHDATIDLLVMTHPQTDHFAGFIDLLRRYRVGAFISSGRKADVGAYHELMKRLTEQAVPMIAVAEGDVIRIGNTALRVLSPSPEERVSGELNDSSVVLLLESPELRALYTGDIGEKTERRLVEAYNLDVEVLKVAHHGSRFSNSEILLAETTPIIATIGVGKNNYGHPAKNILERLSRFAQKIMRTDADGSIQVIPSANTLQVFNLKEK